MLALWPKEEERPQFCWPPPQSDSIKGRGGDDRIKFNKTKIGGLVRWIIQKIKSGLSRIFYLWPSQLVRIASPSRQAI